jgi:erythronate-4-phosphate dehydrogenase
MKIFADKDILAVENSFGSLGELHLFDGRKVKCDDLREADALLVRSITQVDHSLISGTKIRFVGTATSGTDHIDKKCLEEATIHFADAKGSNANAVVDYCFAVLSYAVLHKDFDLENCTVGIIGAGCVGGLFARKLAELGISVRCFDPFLEALSGDNKSDVPGGFFSLKEVLACNVISLHVPLTEEGKHPTKNLIGEAELELMSSGTILINACRGWVVEEEALKCALAGGKELFCAFDVWAGEPEIDRDLLKLLAIATPHIAGYSKEAKSKATGMLSQAFKRFFGLEEHASQSVSPELTPLTLDERLTEQLEFHAVLNAFPIQQLSKQFKRDFTDGAGAQTFDGIRKQLLGRREYESNSIEPDRYSSNELAFLTTLGFRSS